jgi:hypothetical protein
MKDESREGASIYRARVLDWLEQIEQIYMNEQPELTRKPKTKPQPEPEPLPIHVPEPAPPPSAPGADGQRSDHGLIERKLIELSPSGRYVRMENPGLPVPSSFRDWWAVKDIEVLDVLE